MNKSKKLEALLATVDAYLARGKWLQYDQRCFDRKTFLTPRRIKLAPPEMSTEQLTHFLDCSSFIGAVFYETFGYELEADLTWLMVDYVKPRIYFYEFTHEETPEKLLEIEKEMTRVLLPGDVITYDRTVGSGHTMLYVGDGRFVHCTSGAGNPDSYDYENKHSREYENGGLWVDGLSILFSEKRLFSPRVRRVAIERPLELVGELTERANARLTTARGLVCSVLTSHPGAKHASAGDNVEYRVTVKNTSDEDKTVEINFSAPQGAMLVGEGKVVKSVKKDESITVGFLTRVQFDNAIFLDNPEISVNGLGVFAPKVLLGKSLQENEAVRVIDGVKELMLSGKDAIFSASKVYSSIDIAFEESEQRLIQTLFYLHDCPAAEVLCRRTQLSQKDGAVYSMFGGTRVATPEMIRYPYMRCTKVLKRDILPGDLILCSDDVHGDKTYSSFYTGEALIGKFGADEEYCELCDEKIDEFLDSLLGREVFVILRPSMKSSEPYYLSDFSRFV